jgi:MFS family permease
VPPLLAEDATFRRFWLGQCVSLVGDEVTHVALPLLGLLTLGLGPAEIGLLTAAGLAPNLLLSLHAGAWVDRHGGRRRAMIAVDVGRAGLLLLVAFAGLAGVLTRGELYAGAFLLGTLSVLFNVAYSSLFVTLVAREAYVAAGQLLQGARALAGVAGPSLAGLLVQLATAPVALLLDVCSFVVSAVTLWSIHPAETPPVGRAGGDLGAGVRFVVRSPLVRPTLGAIALTSFALTGFQALVLFYAVRTLGFSPGAVGAILGGGAVGAVLGAALAGRIVRSFGVGVAMTWSVVALPASYLLIPLAGGPTALIAATLLAAELGSGFAALVFDVAAGALLAAAVPPAIRARVQGAFMLVNYGARPLGALLASVLAPLLGVRASLLALALLGMLGVLVLLASRVPRLRTLDDIPQTAGIGR